MPLLVAGNDLVSNLTAQDLSSAAPAPAFTSAFHLSKVVHNSSEIEGVTSVEIRPNLNPQSAWSSPGAFDDLISVIERVRLSSSED